MEKQKTRTIPVRVPEETHKSFHKKLIDSGKYQSAQDFLLQQIEEFVKEGK